VQGVVINAKLETGLLSIGQLHLKTEELFLIPELNQVANQKLSQLVLLKFSNVGTLEYNNYRELQRLSYIAHHIYHGEELTPKHHLAENQFHSIQTLTLILKLWNAIESQ
jgi:hypothetical protein